AYEREILLAKLEIQNQTLQQLGEELHDHIGQMLALAKLQLNSLTTRLTDPANLATARDAVDVVSLIIRDVRALTKTLDSRTVNQFGLHDSLTLALERIERTGYYQARLMVTGSPYDLGDETEIILFRMAQESLTNALRHAQARTLTVAADYQSDAFQLCILDDGQGFSPTEATTRPLNQAGSGLGHLQQRARLLGGNCRIESQPGAGTRVEINLPRSRPVA
ncbi:MAG: sensor histidine kinase, partial [Bacteroidetes bacterium]|nr:sensor histidine kinase [Fibrella sp.]